MTATGARAECHDQVVRVLTADRCFRVVVARSTDTVAGVLAAQRVRGGVARVLGDLVTATVLLRETMAPDLRVQGILYAGDGKSRLVGDALPDGATRGLVQIAPGVTEISFGDRARLHTMRSMKHGGIQQGVVAVPDGASVATAMIESMHASEQVVAFVALATELDDDGTVRAAGGCLVQLDPEAVDPPLDAMIARIGALEPLGPILRATDASVDALLERLVGDAPPLQREVAPLRFGCTCSRERVLTSLSTLPTTDVAEIVERNEPLEITCEYCGQEYRLHPDQLRGLLARN